MNYYTLLLLALRIIKLLDRKYQQKLALINNTAEESISKIRTVRSFSNEVKMIALFGRYIDQSYSFGKKNAVVIGEYTVFWKIKRGIFMGTC